MLGRDVAAPWVVARHAGPEERPLLDRDEARLVCPVLEDPTFSEEPRDGLARIRADARAERDPVTPLDGGDRVELHARQSADRLLDLVGPAGAGAGRVALGVDADPPERSDRDGAHVGI